MKKLAQAHEGLAQEERVEREVVQEAERVNKAPRRPPEPARDPGFWVSVWSKVSAEDVRSIDKGRDRPPSTVPGPEVRAIGPSVRRHHPLGPYATPLSN